MQQILQEFWQFLTNNKDPIETLLKILTFLVIPIGGLFTALAWFARRWWRKRLRVGVKTFGVIADSAVLLPKLYAEENNHDPLAHHRIRYQQRDPTRDIQAEFRAALNTTRYLLITAPTGYGKTREASTLAQSLMNEGWRVVRVLKSGWLDIPKEFPPELDDDRRRIVIFLDDLNGLFRTGGFTQSPKTEQMPMLGQPSYHDRLLGVLDAFEKMCGVNEIRVIATARDEEEEWKVLNFDPRDSLWRRFTRFELSAPYESAIIELLEESTARANLLAERTDFPAIARKNDGTFMNAVLNLQRAQKENKPLTLANYTASLDGSWREAYDSVCRKHSAVKYIYDAIEVLRETTIELYPFVVVPTAALLWGGNRLQRLTRRRRIRSTLKYLIDEKILAVSEGKLSPRDGQIEAKGTKVELSVNTILSLVDLVARLTLRHPDEMLTSLWTFGALFFRAKKFVIATALWHLAARISSDESNLYMLVAVTIPLRLEGRERDALPMLDVLANFKPKEAIFLIEIAGLYKDLGNIVASEQYAAEARTLLSPTDWYDLACLESICGNVDIALENLRRAAGKPDFDREWAKRDPDLKWIRNDPRFCEIVSDVG